MLQYLLIIVAILFIGLFILNIYFRVKVFGIYKKLVANQVDFKPTYIFNKTKMEEEVYPKYPDMVEDIQQFSHYIKYSIRMATVFTTLISIVAGLYIFYK